MTNISTPKNIICLMYNKEAEEAAHFYARTFPESSVTGVYRAPADYPMGKKGDVLTVEFIVLGIPCVGVNAGDHFTHSEAFSFQILVDTQDEIDLYWNAILEHGGTESECGWCKDKYGVSWQITPKLLRDSIIQGGKNAEKAFQAMMGMKKIILSDIEDALKN